MASEVDRLLSQIRSETARELLEHKQTLTVGIQPIDDAIEEAAAAAPQASPVIECLGLPGSGKSHVLWHICAKAAMPRTVPTEDDSGSDGVVLNGANKHVLLIDVDGRADMCTLARHMEGVYKDAIANASDSFAAGSETAVTATATERAVRDALSRVHVFAPASTNALVATLCLMPKHLAERRISGPVVLLIDGLGSNYGFERKEASYVRMASRNATPWFRMQQVLVDVIQRVHQQLSCLTVATGLLMLPVSDSAPGAGEGSQQQRIIRVDQGEFRDHMIPRWLSVVSKSFVLERVSSASVMPETTAISITPIDRRTHVKLLDNRLVAHIGDHGLRIPSSRAK
ncbi:hypothetical protein GGI23_002966 [Coemansia sp. RSA 2559]|nr:hypothetical protein GGI23_002966 [Coemansia sp. RSA 2559]KAJ2859159.1 hypothetical protein GGI22_003078 [Coemansia erecta]